MNIQTETELTEVERINCIIGISNEYRKIEIRNNKTLLFHTNMDDRVKYVNRYVSCFLNLLEKISKTCHCICKLNKSDKDNIIFRFKCYNPYGCV